MRGMSRGIQRPERVEQAFRPEVKGQEKAASAAEVILKNLGVASPQAETSAAKADP